ncbi:MAG: TIGR03009 domain-containing protein [Gemmataceae bacterium]
MRGLLILTVLVLTVATLSAQQPPVVAKKTPEQLTNDERRLDMYLVMWEKKMAEVKSLSTVLNRVDTDTILKKSTQYEGWAAYMKAGTGATTLNKAILELKVKGSKEIAEKIVCTGTYVYNYLPVRKIIEQHEMPKNKIGELSDNASLGLMFGMKADVAKKRFHLTLFKEDKDYLYIDVLPKEPADKAEFVRARLVLTIKTMLPRQVWLEQPNGNTTLWDMPNSGANVNLDPKYFDKPIVPKDWKIVPILKQRDDLIQDKFGEKSTPRIIRPASK